MIRELTIQSAGSIPALFSRTGRLCACSLLALMGGCVKYHPQPVSVETFPSHYDARQLDTAEVRAAVARLRPVRVGSTGTDGWDRLALFAAAEIYNPRVAEAGAAARLAQAGRRTARAYPNPNIGLMSEYAKQQTGETSPWLLGFAADVPVDMGTRRTARIALADLVAVQADLDRAQQLWSIFAEIGNALADCLLTRREADVLQAITADRWALQRLLDHRLAVGESDRVEWSRSQILATSDALRLSDARRREQAALVSLAAAVAVSPQALDGMDLSLPGLFEPATPAASSLAGWRRQALLARLDVRRAVADYDAAEQTLRLEVAKQYPQLRLGPGYTWERGLVKLPFTLSMNLPLFNRNQGPIAAAEAARAQAGAHLESVQAAIEAEVGRAERDMTAALSRLADARAQMKTTKAVQDRMAKAVRLGAADRSEWLTASLAVRETELTEIDVLRQVYAARAALETALRRPLRAEEDLMMTRTAVPARAVDAQPVQPATVVRRGRP